MSLPVILSAADTFAHRPGYSTFTDQTRMELLVGGMNDAEHFYTDGSFKDLKNWQMHHEVYSWVAKLDGDDVVGIDMCANDYAKRGGSIDLQWLPPKVADARIYGFDLTGALDTAKLPAALVKLNVGSNKLTGSVDFTRLPPAMTDLHIQHNCFSGEVNLNALPAPMEYLNISNNAFEGTVSLVHLPPGMCGLTLERNPFSGNLVLTNLPAHLSWVSIGGTNIEKVVDTNGDAFEARVIERGFW